MTTPSMTDGDGLGAVVRSALGLPTDTDLDGLAYGQTPEWDSVGHLQLMVALEDALGISIEAEDMVEMGDYPSLRRVLGSRYGVRLAG